MRESAVTPVSSEEQLFTVSATTIIESEHAVKYLTVLCRHFSRKVPSRWTENEGEVQFPVGNTAMQVNDAKNRLEIVCFAKSGDELDKLTSIITHHVAMFSRREPIELFWQHLDLDELGESTKS